ncbi:MAG: phosphoadenylyl-sulfate reductase [Micavibrio sp.]|nr:MAG: phosphoadenylyl-sulfate reductase [Micavibrio sp.]
MSINSYQMAQDLLQRFEDKDGEELLSTIIKDVFLDRICLVSSFGAESALLLDMVSRIDPAFPVIFIDTQKLFPETLEYRDKLIKHFSLQDVRTYYPDYAETSRSDPHETLWKNDVNACCYIRKVEPLERALKGFDAWITGRKRYHGATRENMPLIESANGRIKINPLAKWNKKDIGNAFEKLNAPAHPLTSKGYLSIGCQPCTAIPNNPDDTRSGRWQGQEKTECGIHLDGNSGLQRSKDKIMD